MEKNKVYLKTEKPYLNVSFGYKHQIVSNLKTVLI